MKNKIIIVFTLLCLVLTFNLSAQNRNNRNQEQRKANFERLKAEREKYISKEMGLTEEESKKFWPLYNELQEKKFQLNRDLRNELREIYEALKKGEKVTEAEYDKIIQSNAKIKIKEAELDKTYTENFRKFLSAEKVFKFQRAEQRFARQMLGERDREKGNNNSKSK